MKYENEILNDEDLELERIKKTNIKTRIKFLSFFFSLACLLFMMATGKFDRVYILAQIRQDGFKCTSSATFNADDKAEDMQRKATTALANNLDQLHKLAQFNGAMVKFESFQVTGSGVGSGLKPKGVPRIELYSSNIVPSQNLPAELCGFQLVEVFQ